MSDEHKKSYFDRHSMLLQRGNDIYVLRREEAYIISERGMQKEDLKLEEFCAPIPKENVTSLLLFYKHKPVKINSYTPIVWKLFKECIDISTDSYSAGEEKKEEQRDIV